MTKLISGRVKKIPSANVSASRYDFIKLSETEPDLGLPAGNGYVLSGNVNGTRQWILPSTVATTANVANTVLSISNFTTANLAEGSNLYFTNARSYANLTAASINALADVDTVTLAPGLGYGLVWNGTNWVPNVITVSSTELSNVANTVLGIVQSSLVANTAFFASNADIANIALTANIANTVLTLSNFTTSNLIEGANLYFTNTRVYANVIGLLNAKANVVDLTTANVLESTGNLYYTNARVYANIAPLLTTANIAEIDSNLYYTNARVYANIAPLLTTANITESASNLYFTNTRVYANVSERLLNLDSNIIPAADEVYNLGSPTRKFKDLYLSGFTLSLGTTTLSAGQNNSLSVTSLITNNVTSNIWTNLYTANVIESVSNLYFTNARVYANIAPLLTTANVSEVGNLYFTNARVYANIAPLLTTANIAEIDSNLYYTNARVYSNVIGLLNAKANIVDLTTANVIESASNLYFTNARVYANIAPLLTTANILEVGANIYYTNARVYSNVVSLLTTYTGNISAGNIITGGGGGGSITGANLISANVITASIWNGIYTANVIETLGNLYFTNARASANVIGLLPSLAGNNISIAANGQISAVMSVGALGTLYTSNIVEDGNTTTGNVYFTNTRARAAISAYDGSIVYNPVTGTIRATGEVVANITATVSSLTTANIAESPSNLYYTNARARATISSGTGVSYDSSSGVVSIGQNVSPNASVTFANLTVTGTTNFYGNVTTHSSNNLSISDNMIYLNSGSESSNPDLGFAGNYNDGSYHHAGFFRDASDGTWKVFDNYSPEPDANIFIDTNHATFRLANLAATNLTGNVVGNVTGFVSSIANFNTTNLAEGTQLYYTNARVHANIISLLPTYTGNITAGNIVANAIVTNTIIINGYELFSNNDIVVNRITANSWANIYTSNVIETAGNLYFTNARVYSNVISLLPTYTGNLGGSNLSLGTGSGGSITGANLISVNIVTASIWNGLYTANVIESTSNLYFTNARVYSNVLALLPTLAGDSITIAANGRISATTSAGTITGLNTANVIESTSNLYFTNARVYANIISLLPTYTGNIAAGNIRANSIVTNTIIINGYELFSNNDIVVNRITANIWANLYTANVIESTGNLYFTNARVYSNVIGLLNAKANVFDLTTANVIESTSNLYYTNARVYSNVVSLLPTYNGDITASNITVTTRLTANAINATSIYGSSIGGSITGANLISTVSLVANAITVANLIQTNNISSINWLGLYTANVIESGNTTTGNVYFTNARVYANVISLLSTYTGNIAAGNIRANSIVTNTIIINGVEISNTQVGANININSITANIWNGLYTANVLETSGNLYYTNARVYSNVIAALPTYTGNLNIGNLSLGTGVGGSLTGANLISTNVIAATIWTGLYTSNVIENGNTNTGNVYFSNARVISLLSTYTGNINGGNLSLGTGSGGSLTGANLISTNVITATIWTGLYTSNVIESASNLYFTNARVAANVIGLLPSLAGNNIIIAANGQISAVVGGGGSGAVLATSIIGLNTANVIESTSNLYYTNARVYANVVSLLPTYTGNIAAGNIVANAIVTNTIIINGVEISNTQVGANITINRISANIWANLYTANVIESTSNLYYTNARVYANVVSLLPTYTGNIGASNLSIGTGVGGSITGANLISVNIVTANIWNGLYTANVLETSGNLYFTNARVYANVIGLLNAKANVVDLTTSNVVELNNLYYTNARVYANVLSLLPTYTGNITGGNLSVTGYLFANGIILQGANVTGNILTGTISSGTALTDTITANSITSNIWVRLYTSNVIENGNTTSGNVYFTNTRAIAAFIAGDSITIEANGRISAGATAAATQLAITSSQVLAGGNKNYTLASVINSANTILVSINGVVQIPALDYTLSGGQGLVFTANTPANAAIEVKYYGYSALNPNVAVISSSSIIPTVEGQASYLMGANATQAATVMVALDGLIQRPTVDYTVNNTTITMIPAPPAGSNIEVRFFGQEAVALSAAQSTTAYISNSRTYAGGSANLDLGSNILLARNIIVTVDGITQIPDYNYTVSGNTLSFGTSVPSINSIVEVKFFGAEAFNANLTQAMVTAVLPAVLSNDTLVRQIIRSSAYAFSRIFY